MIVKVQRALFPKGSPALIYTRNRSWQGTLPLETLPPEVQAALKDEPKAYFNATMRGTLIEFGSQVRAQDW